MRQSKAFSSLGHCELFSFVGAIVDEPLFSLSPPNAVVEGHRVTARLYWGQGWFIKVNKALRLRVISMSLLRSYFKYLLILFRWGAVHPLQEAWEDTEVKVMVFKMRVVTGGHWEVDRECRLPWLQRTTLLQGWWALCPLDINLTTDGRPPMCKEKGQRYLLLYLWGNHQVDLAWMPHWYY